MCLYTPPPFITKKAACKDRLSLFYVSVDYLTTNFCTWLPSVPFRWRK